MKKLVEQSVPDARDFYVCPICRMAFAVERAGSSAVVCPGCEHLLSVEAQEAGIKSANQLLLEFDEGRKVEWERDQKPVVERSNTAALFMWGILSCCVLGVGYVTALAFTGEETEVSEQQPEGVDYAALARGAMERFCQCETAEEYWPLLDQAEVNKQVVEDYLEGFRGSLPSRLLQMGPVEGTGSSARVVADLQTTNGIRQVLIRFKDGEARIDWLSYSGQNKIAIEDLKADGTAVLRCVLSPANNYDFSFPEEDWYCVQLSFVQQPVPVYGYIAREEKALWQQMELLFGLRGSTMATVEARRLSVGTGDDKFQLIRLVANTWVLPE